MRREALRFCPSFLFAHFFSSHLNRCAHHLRLLVTFTFSGLNVKRKVLIKNTMYVYNENTFKASA
jgi:hypothetical protein